MASSKNKKNEKIYVLVEHQSSPDRFMPWRILQYTCDIIHRHLIVNKHCNKLPFIYPFVFYHGMYDYNHPEDIRELVGYQKEIVDKYFLKSFQLIDVTQLDDVVLTQSINYGCAALEMKYAFMNIDENEFQNILSLIKKNLKYNDDGYVHLLLEYFINMARIQSNTKVEKIYAYIFEHEPGEEKMAITLGEYIKEKGRKEGRREAVNTVKQAIACRLLKENAELEWIAKITKLSISALEKLQEKGYK